MKVINLPSGKGIQTREFRRKQTVMNVSRGYLINSNVEKKVSQKSRVLDAPIKTSAVESEEEPNDSSLEKSLEQAEVKVEAKLIDKSVKQELVSVTSPPAIPKTNHLRVIEHHVYQKMPVITTNRNESISEKQHPDNLDNGALASTIPVHQSKCDTWQVETWMNYLAVTAQFDTRSTYSYIRQDVVNELVMKNGSLEIRPCTNLHIFSTKGERTSVIGTVYLNLMICGRKCPVELRVVHALSTFLVLGMDFLKSNWIIADFGQQSWSFMDNLTLKFPFSSCNFVEISLPTMESDFKDKWIPFPSTIHDTDNEIASKQTRRIDKDGHKDYNSHVRDHQIKRRDRPWKVCRKCGIMIRKGNHRCFKAQKY